MYAATSDARSMSPESLLSARNDQNAGKSSFRLGFMMLSIVVLHESSRGSIVVDLVSKIPGRSCRRGCYDDNQ